MDEFGGIPTITVRLKYTKKKAIANINEADFDPERHERLTRKELELLHVTRGSVEDAAEAAAAEEPVKAKEAAKGPAEPPERSRTR